MAITHSRRPYFILGVVAVLLVLVAADYRSSVDFRARRYFSIPWQELVSASSIRAAVLRLLPVGTPLETVPGRLALLGIGGDGLSGYYPLPSRAESVIRLEYDPRHFALVQKHYGIFLSFEDEHLSTVRVDEWFTGL